MELLTYFSYFSFFSNFPYFIYFSNLKIAKLLKDYITKPYEIIKINKPANYKFTKKNIYKIFIKKILNITGEETIKTLSKQSFIINYRKKICYFYEFKYFCGFIIMSFKPYKIILTHPINPIINIFIFNKIDL